MSGKVTTSSANTEEGSPYIHALVDDLENFFWLVGLAEGEAYFGYERTRGSPKITIQMTDEATIARAASLFRTTHWSPSGRTDVRQATYRAEIGGKRALVLMLRMYPYMCPRRQAQIRLVERLYTSERPEAVLDTCVPLFKTQSYSVIRTRLVVA